MEEPPCEHINRAGKLGPVCRYRTCDLWMCQKITRDRDIVVQRCCATRNGWITHDTDVCYLPFRVRSKNPLHQPTTGVTLTGFLAVLRDQGPVDVGVIQNYLQRVPLIWPFPLRVGVDVFSMQPLRRFRESKREYGA